MMTAWGEKRWFITGASTGFGKAMARGVLAGGGSVIATARDVGSLADLVAEGGDRVLPLALDVTDPQAVLASVAQAEATGGIDVLVNNAGYGFLGGVEESSDEEIARQFEVNFFGLLRMIRAALPGMRARSSGYIVNMSSIAGIRGMAGAGFYVSSKFALEGLSEALQGECRGFGIRVLVVEPGYFRTEFSGRSLTTTISPHPDYAFLLRQREKAAAADGVQPGDPDKALGAMLQAMDSETPPLRLLLGSDAYGFGTDTFAARSAEIEAWRQVSESTDFALPA
ncbi:MAG: oxidoreductase [Novosphingobium sp.]